MNNGSEFEIDLKQKRISARGIAATCMGLAALVLAVAYGAGVSRASGLGVASLPQISQDQQRTRH